jgi:acyl carrier protein
LREYLLAKLPNYMVPTAFVPLDVLPLTPNGKVDRKALPAPGSERPELGASYVAPSGPTERILSEIWAQALALEKVGIHDNFFDLGGHSLLLVQVQAKVCEKLKTSISIVEMFQYPTINSLARHISQPSAGSGRLQKVQERTRRRKEALGRQREMTGKG